MIGGWRDDSVNKSAEDPFGQIMTACNSSSRGSNTYNTTGTRTCMYLLTKTQTLNFKNLTLKKIRN